MLSQNLKIIVNHKTSKGMQFLKSPPNDQCVTTGLPPVQGKSVITEYVLKLQLNNVHMPKAWSYN